MKSRRIGTILIFLAALTVSLRAEPVNLLPNGTFEFWDRFSELALRRKGGGLWAEDPPVPTRWLIQVANPASIKPSSDCHGGESAAAFAVPGKSTAEIEMFQVELMPKAVYSFGFWSKGSGRVTMTVNGLAVEGRQPLASVGAAAGAAWSEARGSFTVPGHIRTVCINLSVAGESDLVIDDVFIAAILKEPYDADAALGKKCGKDEHTLFFEDFDGPSHSAVVTCKEIAVTDAQGGRFGRGLRLDRKGSASIPLEMGAMPEEGTLEFWISPDSHEGMPYLSLMARDTLLSIGNWPGGISINSRYPGLKNVCTLRGYSPEIDIMRMRRGVWHHMAYTWDRNTLRLYLDGVLSDMKTLDTFQWPETPSFIQLRTPFPNPKQIDGTIDEIRLSNIRRYGPVVPSGLEYTVPLRLPDASEQAARADVRSKPSPSAAHLAEARQKMIGSIAPTRQNEFENQPNPDGAYVYEAASAKPLVKGGQCLVEADRFVKGLSVVRSAVAATLLPDGVSNEGVYWTVGDIKKSEYWIGLLYEGDGSSEYTSPFGVYLNGRMVQFATQSDPVQVAPGVWFLEAFAARSENICPGDEIAVVFKRGAGKTARVTLRDKAPVPASNTPWRVPTNFGGNQWNLYTALGVNVEGRFLDNSGQPVPNERLSSIQQLAPSIESIQDATGQVHFAAYLSNPLPVPVTVDYRCRLKSFHAETAAEDSARITLAPHERVKRRLQFDWKEGEQTYFADLVLLANETSPNLSKGREDGGLGWPDHEALSYFPGHRHILPWPDPFNTRVVRRITLAQPFAGIRQVYGLDGGDWEIGYTTDLEPPIPVPPEIAFSKVSVPKRWATPRLSSMTPRPHGAYFRKTVDLPRDISGRSFSLLVDQVYAEATAYVNGQRVGNARGDRAPMVCDITKALKPGKNELIFVVRDIIAIMNPAYVNKESPVGNHRYLEAPGLHGGDGLALGSVNIASAPAVSSEAVFVVPSVRNKTVAARITAANRGRTESTVRIRADVLDDGKPVLTLGEKELSLKPDAPVVFTLEKRWEDPQLWGPGNPYLYVMRVTVTEANTGELLDSRRDRFGFRESWIDGAHIMFNGYPIRPVGHQPMIRFRPKGNFLLSRGGGDDWRDEVGLLCYRGGISGVYNSASQHNVENDKFWEAAQVNSITALKMTQNSPHIVAWDISNEWLCYFWGDPMQGAKRFKTLSDAIRAYDPTRWTLANAEGDLHGLLDNHSFHYMRPYFGGGNRFTMNGRTPYLPDEAFWRSLDRHFTPGADIRYCPLNPLPLNPDRKVIMNNEFLWKCGMYFMPPGPTRVIGEDDVLSAAVDGGSGPVAWMWKTWLDGHRDMGVSLINPYSFHPGVVRGGFLEQTFIIPENQRHGYSGAKQTRRFSIVNSLFRPHAMTLRWSLADKTGKPVQNGREARTMGSGEIQRGEFSFVLPVVQKKDLFTLNVTLESDGDFVSAEEWDIAVYPVAAPELGPLARRLLLYDPEGTTAPALEAMKVPFRAEESLDTLPDDPGGTVLVIGEDALSQFSARITAPLSGFVERGGRVIVLAQKAAPANLPVETYIEPRNWSSQVYLRAGSHPVLEGIGEHDLHFWQPDRSVGTGAYAKPFSGSFVTILDTSFHKNMDWAQMMEVFRGEGSYLLCQLPLASRHDVEPVARQLLANIVKYACGESAYARPVKTLSAVTDSASETAEVLRKLQIRHRLVGADAELEAGSTVLIDADFAREASAKRKASWTEQLRNGAEWLIVNAEPRDAGWISAMAGTRVEFSSPPYERWAGRGFRKGWSRFTSGLSQLDLYWKHFSQDEKAGAQAEALTNIIEPFQYYAASAEHGRELIFPGVLVEIPAGKGTLLVDQRRWMPKDETLAKLAMRNISTLMTALHVGMSSYITPRSLPKDLAFRSVELASRVNFRLQTGGETAAAESVAGAKEKALLPKLNGFPEASRTFLGVPFALAGGQNNGIALASEYVRMKEPLPEDVVVPVGYLVEGLYFLHTAANAGDGLAANYQVVYEDGSAFDVPVRGGVHIADWHAPMRVPGAEIVWTGSHDLFPMTAVYRMLWVNHKPETPIREIVFSNPERKAFPALIGITAAARKETIPVSPEDAAKARTSYRDGLQAFQTLNLDSAQRLLKNAILTDASLAEAYPALAEVAEKKGNEDWILDAYRLWTISGPRQPLPWNRMGELLEKRGDFKGALEAYTRSLDVEWNQPPIIEARTRMETVRSESIQNDRTSGKE